MWWDILKLQKLSVEELSVMVMMLDPAIGSEPLRDILNATVYPIQLSSKTRMILKRISARKEVGLKLSKLVNRLAIGGKNVIPRTIPESLLDVINASNFSLLNRNLRQQITGHYPRPYINININVIEEDTIVYLDDLNNGIFTYGSVDARGGILKFNADEDIQYVLDECRNMGYEIYVKYMWYEQERDSKHILWAESRGVTNKPYEGYNVVNSIEAVRTDPVNIDYLQRQSLFDIGYNDTKLSTKMYNNVSILKRWLINNKQHKDYPELIELFVAWDKVNFKKGHELDLIIEFVEDKKMFKNEYTIH